MTVSELIEMLKNLQKCVGDKNVSLCVEGRVFFSYIPHYDQKLDTVFIEDITSSELEYQKALMNREIGTEFQNEEIFK